MNAIQNSVFATAQRMEERGLPRAFIVDVLRESLSSDGMYDLLLLWDEAPTEKDRQAVVADLADLLLDREPPLEQPVIRNASDVERHMAAVGQWKHRLRQVIDRNGGVSQVARRAQMAQPSLSRLLRSTSIPRASTIKRLARALGLHTTEIAFSSTPVSGGAGRQGSPMSTTAVDEAQVFPPMGRSRLRLPLFFKTLAADDPDETTPIVHELAGAA